MRSEPSIPDLKEDFMFEVLSLWRQGLLPRGKIGTRMHWHAAGSVAGTTLIFGGLGAMLFFGSYGSPPPNDSIALSLITSFGVAMAGIVFTFVSVSTLGDLRYLFRDVRGKLSLSLQDFQKLQPKQLEALARGCLCEIGSRLVAIEKRTQPYDPERIEVKAEFEHAYRKFREFGLIGAVPFNEFIPQS